MYIVLSKDALSFQTEVEYSAPLFFKLDLRK